MLVISDLSLKRLNKFLSLGICIYPIDVYGLYLHRYRIYLLDGSAGTQQDLFVITHFGTSLSFKKLRMLSVFVLFYTINTARTVFII